MGYWVAPFGVIPFMLEHVMVLSTLTWLYSIRVAIVVRGEVYWKIWHRYIAIACHFISVLRACHDLFDVPGDRVKKSCLERQEHQCMRTEALIE